MSKIQWRDAFSIGHEEIDSQHQQWIAIYNQAHDRMMNFDGRTAASIGRDALSEMVQYGKAHFAFEEDYMRSIAFPDADHHREMHLTFAMKMDQVLLQMKQDEPMLNSEVIKVIENWLVDHILNEDQKMQQYSKK